MLGHQWAVGLLREHVARQSLRHAYLFTGPQGVGRRTLALRLSQAVNCLQPPEPVREAETPVLAANNKRIGEAHGLGAPSNCFPET